MRRRTANAEPEGETKEPTEGTLGTIAAATGEQKNEEEDDGAHCCWICYETTGRDEMVRPCCCRGSMQYVHGDCLLKWVTVNAPGHGRRMHCPHCLAQYRLKSSTTTAAEAAVSAQLEREHQPWPAGHLLPVHRRLEDLDPILADDITWRLRACATAALPALLNALASLVVLLEGWREVEAEGDGELLRRLPRTALDKWLVAWGGASFEDPRLEVGVGSVWVWAFRWLQGIATWCCCAAMVMRLAGWHEWVDWSTTGHLRSWRCLRGTGRSLRFLLCVNLPLPRLVRIALVSWALRLLRPWRAHHARLWHFAYHVFDSRAEVTLSALQTIFVLLMWLAAAQCEWRRARRQVRTMFRLKRLGTLQIANHDDENVIATEDTAAAYATLTGGVAQQQQQQQQQQQDGRHF